MQSKTPIVIETMSDLAAHDMTLALYCISCDRWYEIIPQHWMDEGNADVVYVEREFKCKDCGKYAEKQVRTKSIGLAARHFPSRSKSNLS